MQDALFCNSVPFIDRPQLHNNSTRNENDIRNSDNNATRLRVAYLNIALQGIGYAKEYS